MIKKLTKEAAPQRSPRSHDFEPGNTSVYQPGKYRDYYKVETNYPSNHPEYTHQTDQFNSSMPESLGRPMSDEQIFQLLKKTKGWTREQFDKFLNKSADVIPGGLADRKSPEDFDQEALEKGIGAELEHTSSRQIATEIAMDHLVEDPEYYQKLEKMEKFDECARKITTASLRGFSPTVAYAATPPNSFVAKVVKRASELGEIDNIHLFDAAVKLNEGVLQLREALGQEALDTKFLRKILDTYRKEYEAIDAVKSSYDNIYLVVSKLIEYERSLLQKQDLIEDYVERQDLGTNELKILYQVMQTKPISKELSALLGTDPDPKWRKLAMNLKSFTRSASVTQEMVEKVKGTETVEEIFEGRDPNEEVTIEEKNLGNGALAETLPDGTVIINDDVDEVGDWEAARLVHELAHVVDWQEENYLDRPQERNAFQKQIQYLVEESYTLSEITNWFLPIFTDYKSEPESRKLLKEMYDESVASLKRVAKVAQVQNRVNLQFTPEEKTILDKIEGAADKLGIKVFLAGGLIRDRLSGIENSDLDFVTNKGSAQLAAYLVKAYGLSDAITMDRSGATMIHMGGRYIDIIDAEKVFSPVKAGAESLEQGQEAELSIFMDDAYRRDLTINSLMYALGSGKLYDPTGKGLADVQNKVIRTIIDPNLKYRIHAPDMLRAIRFYATKPGFKFAPGMLDAMRANADKLTPRNTGGDMSARRIERELRKAKTEEEWNRMKGTFAEIGLNKYIGEQIQAVEDDKKGDIEYGFDKGAAVKEVSMIAVSTDENNLLMGIRNKEKKWTLPGGHIDGDETPVQAAIRELKEETDITATEDDLIAIGSEEVIQTGTKDTPITVHSFTLMTDQTETDSSNDPDEEVGTWEWVEVQNGLPDSIRAELHNIDDVTLNQLGLIEPLEKKVEGKRIFENLIGASSRLKGGVSFRVGLRRVAQNFGFDPFQSLEEAMDAYRALSDLRDRGDFNLEAWERNYKIFELHHNDAKEELDEAMAQGIAGLQTILEVIRKYKDETVAGLEQEYRTGKALEKEIAEYFMLQQLENDLTDESIAVGMLSNSPRVKRKAQELHQDFAFDESLDKDSSLRSFTKTSANMRGELQQRKTFRTRRNVIAKSVRQKFLDLNQDQQQVLVSNRMVLEDIAADYRRGVYSRNPIYIYCGQMRVSLNSLKRAQIPNADLESFIDHVELLRKELERPIQQFDVLQMEEMLDRATFYKARAEEAYDYVLEQYIDADNVVNFYKGLNSSQALNQAYANRQQLSDHELKALHQAILHGPADAGLLANLLLDPNDVWRQLGRDLQQTMKLEEQDESLDKDSFLRSFTKTSANMRGEPLADTSALPQEQTFTYPYDEGDPKLIDRNYNGGNTLKQKEMQRKIKKLKDLLKRSK